MFLIDALLVIRWLLGGNDSESPAEVADRMYREQQRRRNRKWWQWWIRRW